MRHRAQPRDAHGRGPQTFQPAGRAGREPRRSDPRRCRWTRTTPERRLGPSAVRTVLRLGVLARLLTPRFERVANSGAVTGPRAPVTTGLAQRSRARRTHLQLRSQTIPAPALVRPPRSTETRSWNRQLRRSLRRFFVEDFLPDEGRDAQRGDARQGADSRQQARPHESLDQRTVLHRSPFNQIHRDPSPGRRARRRSSRRSRA